MSLPRKKLPSEELERLVSQGSKRFVKRDEGMEIYSLGRHSFDKLAREAKASLHFCGNALFDCEKINAYLEKFYDYDDD